MQLKKRGFDHTAFLPISLFLVLICCRSSFSQTLYSATGRASFYAKKFEGRKTSNGEKFSNKNFTAAHRTLPFGTLVKVTNLSNDKSIVVRINDRGPYVKNRIIDLSRIAADSLDFIDDGWIVVKVEELPPPIVNTGSHILNDVSLFRFPYDWMGKWSGDLKVYNASGLKQKVSMELQILPTALPDHFKWIISYDSTIRDYELIRRDSVNRTYSLDEKNGIDIMCALLGNHFISRFTIDGQLLESEYTLHAKDELEFEIRGGNAEPNWTTGNVIMENDSVPAVGVLKVSVLQVAELHRSKE